MNLERQREVALYGKTEKMRQYYHRIKPKDQWREALIASEKALLLILPLRCGRSRLQTGGASSPRDHLLLELAGFGIPSHRDLARQFVIGY